MVRRGLFSITSTVGPGRGFIIIIIVAAAAATFIVLGCEAADYDQKYNHCNTSTCGNLGNISYPFRLTDDPPNCGDPRYQLSCENNRTVLYLYSGRYYVESISYENRTMVVVDSGLHIHNCSSLPLNSLTLESNFSYSIDQNDPYFYPWHWVFPSQNYLVFMTCETPITFTSTPTFPLLVNTSPCINASSGSHSYVTLGKYMENMEYSEVPDSCTIGKIFPIRYTYDYEPGARPNTSFSEIHHQLFMGFQLSWYAIDCVSCEGSCYPRVNDSANNVNAVCIIDNSSRNCTRNIFRSLLHHPFYCTAYYLPGFFGTTLPDFLKKEGKYLEGIMIARTSVGILCLCTMLIYMLRRRHFSMDHNIEEFLQEHNNLMLLQYSYSDIKKMTKHFSDKLGRGGFGSVYKGKLRSGNLVAIKMLENSKGNGQDFINEVGTIGRIHHVNVVQLIGFCFEGSKRALVYDFMPNGSLDKYIFSTQEQAGFSLSWEKMYKIALGVAHGIEYLHRGCDMQILHFDIKPHNILLNEDFTPKISDFGLAKLYATNDNTVPLTGARGTMGYIAPELVYKSMGGVSYKADVYSFGMLLMEMAGRRKNVNPFANSASSQIYFPSWIYEKLNRGEDMEMEDANEEDKQIVRKMIIVALSCIQLRPGDRPSMSRVIEMLESPTELLQMPPRPFLGSSFGRVEEDQTTTTSLHSTSSSNYSLEIESN